MGGTSTDVALYAGELERTTDAVIASVRVSAPMLKIQTVAAGGGSILSFGQGRLQVGPESAGALPGPRCYRHGGPLTVTDANLLLGRIHPEYFPRVFGPNADEPLDADATNDAFAALARDIAAATGDAPGPEQVAAGFVRIAVERMANAIKQISVQRGHDVTRFALCCFGGAGGQHAAQVAETLGIHTVIIHPLAGVLSAYGIGVADVRVLRQISVEAPLDPARRRNAGSPLRDARGRARSKRCASKAPTQRTRGSSGACSSRSPEPIRRLPVAWRAAAAGAELAAAFRELHERHFGFRVAADAALVVESLELEAVVPGLDDAPAAALPPAQQEQRSKPIARREDVVRRSMAQRPRLRPSALPAGTRLDRARADRRSRTPRPSSSRAGARPCTRRVLCC